MGPGDLKKGRAVRCTVLSLFMVACHKDEMTSTKGSRFLTERLLLVHTLWAGRANTFSNVKATFKSRKGESLLESRLAKLEAAVEALQAENRKLRDDLQDLQLQLADARELGSVGSSPLPRKLPARWSVIVMALALLAVPILAITVWHANAFWSTTIGAVNGLVLYIVGPGVWRLLVEGLFRAIPGVLFGQAARVAVDKYRQRRADR